MNGFENHGIEHLSPSQLNMWCAAPSAWVVSKLLGNRFAVGPPAERGKAVEDGVSMGLFHPETPIQECQDHAVMRFDQGTALMMQLEPADRDKHHAQIRAMVEMAIDALRPLGIPQWPGEHRQNRIEIACRFKQGNDGTVPVIGFLDFLYDDLIVDLKTTTRMPSKMNASHSRQAAVYAKAAGKPIKFLYVTPKAIRWLEPDDIDGHLADIKSQVARLERFLRLSDDPKVLASVVPHDPSSFYWNGNLQFESQLG